MTPLAGFAGQLDRVGDLRRSRAPAAWLVPKLCRELCRVFEEAHKKVCKDAGKTGARSPEGGTPANG